jgi:hypothetical protein
MKLHYLLLPLAALVLTEASARQVQATCSQGSGEKQLARVSADYIELRSGSASRSVPIADIESIEVTGPVNRAQRFAWATVKTHGADAQKVGLVLPNAGTLLLDGVTSQGKPDSIDVLDCKRVVFKGS